MGCAPAAQAVSPGRATAGLRPCSCCSPCPPHPSLPSSGLSVQRGGLRCATRAAQLPPRGLRGVLPSSLLLSCCSGSASPTMGGHCHWAPAVCGQHTCAPPRQPPSPGGPCTREELRPRVAPPPPGGQDQAGPGCWAKHSPPPHPLLFQVGSVSPGCPGRGDRVLRQS